ncbi:AI-2E family transporter [Plectonema cf. radiosum LEGE 06105]|uniref:AI-2E family transporter n=1 Tax=Plectonema cf. radiosum LEGE 06105 TaxID=945769 RepID=A0A8J7F0Q6_9CYAN|nr:AI-2E family transporter [Plectonema radiosum]MBE9212400.1 AI-2E family transporter [Plectonema cf. radiosum LEGE 06105]
MRLGKWIGLFALVVSIYILWQIRQVLLIVFAAVVLATALNQIVKILEKIRIKRGFAVGISVLLLLVIISGFFALIAPRIIEQLRELTFIVPKFLDQMRLWNDWLLKVIPEQVLDEIQGLRYLTQGLQTWLDRILGNFFLILSQSLNVVLSLLLFFVLTIMLLIDPKPYRSGFIMLFPAFYRRRMDEILHKCENYLVGWIKGTLLTMFLIGTLSYISLLILGVRLPLINAIIAGLLEFIPNVGPTLSLIPPLLLALLDAPWKAFAVIALYFGIQQVESLIVVPLIMKSQVSLLPVITLLAVVIFGSFFGFLGVFLAIPLVIVVQVFIQEILVKDVLNNWHSANGNNQTETNIAFVDINLKNPDLTDDSVINK